LRERGVEQLRLGCRRPEAIARPSAVAEAGTIERDHAVIARQAVEQAARLEVAFRDHVAVDQHDRGPFALLDDMQAHTVDLEQGGRRPAGYRSARRERRSTQAAVRAALSSAAPPKRRRAGSGKFEHLIGSFALRGVVCCSAI
jgi:hypothetical protein